MKFKTFDIYDFEFSPHRLRMGGTYRRVIQRLIILEQQQSANINRIRVLKIDENTKEAVISWLTLLDYQQPSITKVGHLEIEDALTSDEEAVRQEAKKYFEALLEEDLL